MHGVPVSRASVGAPLAITQGALLGHRKLCQQLFDGGWQVVGVGPDLHHQCLVNREIDGPFASRCEFGFHGMWLPGEDVRMVRELPVLVDLAHAGTGGEFGRRQVVATCTKYLPS